MAEKLKKKWRRPQLTVLVRGEPAEQVLQGCKTFGEGPSSGLAECEGDMPPEESGCIGCSTGGPS
jgi:hypothetical protein